MSSITDRYERPNFYVSVQKRILPFGYSNRTGQKQIPKYIVIHEVSLGKGKSPENYNMDYYEQKIFREGAEGKSVGYHFLVGDKEIYQFIPEDEVTCHTGTRQGNKESIGVERLICEGISYDHALHNQAKLIATLMVKWNIPIECVVTHKGMQQIYEPTIKDYKLQMNGETCKIGIFDFLAEYHNLLNIYEKVMSLISFSDFEKNETIISCRDLIGEVRKILNDYEKLSGEQVSQLLFKMIELQSKLIKMGCTITNQVYLPREKRIETLEFSDQLILKECPSRLLAGLYGGLSKFYDEIQKCLEEGLFFEELFRDERPKIQNNFQRMKVK